MTLPGFIRGEIEIILIEWDSFARTVLPDSSGMSAERLRDHAREMLLAIAADMGCKQSPAEQHEKSRGLRRRVHPQNDSAAETHALHRLGEGFTLIQLVAEYRALRASVIRLWTARMGHSDRSHLNELTRFNEAVDEALSESIARYTTRLERSRDLMLGALGHDLRNPLGAVLQSAHYLLRAEELSGAQTKAAARILSSGTRMKQIIGDLLDFASTRLGDALPMMPEPMDLGLACQAAVDEMAAAHPHCEITCDVQGALSGYWDLARIGQLLSNLIGNAIEHGAQDTPIGVRASCPCEGDVRVEIHNQGLPIPHERRQYLFEPLTRGAVDTRHHASANRSVGLGLYIACQIAKAHGGTLELASSDARGTTFVFQVPKSPSSLPTKDMTPAARAASRASD